MDKPIRTRPPLGIPAGSVRALLSLLIVSVVILETVRGHDLELPLIESLMMVLALYFSSRRLVGLTSATIARLEAERQIPEERHPLYLPRFSIRVIILASFIGLGVYLYREDRLFATKTLESLGLVGAYLVGALLRPLGGFLRRWELPAALLERFGDARALVVLGAVGTLSVYYWLDQADHLPYWGQQVALNLLLFYFGAR